MLVSNTIIQSKALDSLNDKRQAWNRERSRLPWRPHASKLRCTLRGKRCGKDRRAVLKPFEIQAILNIREVRNKHYNPKNKCDFWASQIEPGK